MWLWCASPYASLWNTCAQGHICKAPKHILWEKITYVLGVTAGVNRTLRVGGLCLRSIRSDMFDSNFATLAEIMWFLVVSFDMYQRVQLCRHADLLHHSNEEGRKYKRIKGVDSLLLRFGMIVVRVDFKHNSWSPSQNLARAPKFIDFMLAITLTWHEEEEEAFFTQS